MTFQNSETKAFRMPSAFSAPGSSVRGDVGKTDSTVDGTEVVEDNNFTDDNDADDNPRFLSVVMTYWEF